MEIFDEKFWLAICFIIFVYISYRPIKKAILNSLDAKILAIKAYLSEAEKLKNEAEILLQDTQKQLSELDSLKTKILSNAQAEIDNLILIRNQEIDKLIERKEQDALNNIKITQKQQIRAVQTELMQKVTELVTAYFIDQKDQLSDLEIAKNINGKKDLLTK